MNIRQYNDRDFNQVVDSLVPLKYLCKYLNKGFPWNFLSMIGLITSKYYVMEDEKGKIVAGGSLRIKNILFQKSIWLYGLRVRKEFRKQGFGSQIMKWRINKAIELNNGNTDNIFLVVDTDNSIAYNFHKMMGFETVKHRKGQYIMKYKDNHNV